LQNAALNVYLLFRCSKDFELGHFPLIDFHYYKRRFCATGKENLVLDPAVSACFSVMDVLSQSLSFLVGLIFVETWPQFCRP